MPWNMKPKCPYNKKYQLVDHFVRKYPNKPVSDWTKLKKEQLIKLWYEI